MLFRDMPCGAGEWLTPAEFARACYVTQVYSLSKSRPWAPPGLPGSPGDEDLGM